MDLLASLMVNTTAAPPGPPGPADDKPTDGYCDNANVWFLVYVALGVVTWLGNLAVMAFASAKPVPGRINYGRPWTVVHLLLSILVWNCLPSALGFFVFHFVIPHASGSYMEAATRFTCTAIYGAVPFFGLFFAFQAVLLIAAYQPQQYNETIAKLLLPANHIDEMAANQSPAQKARFHSPTVLVYGSVSRGNVYLEVLKRMLCQYDSSDDVKARCNAPRAIMADVAKMRSFVAVNADAMDMPAGTVEVVDVGPIHVAPSAPVSGGAAGAVGDGLTVSEQSMPTAGPPGNDPMKDDLYDSRLANATRSFSNAGGDATVPPPLQLPLTTGYVDEVMIGPFLRKSPPMGDFITDAATVRHHVQLAAEEIRRVLRPGGRVRVVDGLLETLATEADLMAVGFTIVQPTHSLHCTAGSVIGLRKPMYCCIVESVPQSAGDAERLEQQEAEIAAGLQVRNSEVLRAVPSNMFHEPNSATGSNLYDDTQSNLLAAGSPRKPDEMAVFAQQMHAGRGSGKQRTVYHAAGGPGYRVLLLCQFMMYVLLLAIAASVAHPLNTPSRVPVGTRVGTLLFSVCYNYPMMAYFSRMVAASRPATVSLGAMVAGVMQTEVFSSGASLLLSGVLYVPQLGLQWGLASTSLSLSVRSYIGIAISVLIGVVAYKRGAKAATVKTLKAIDVPEDRYNQLLASA